MIQEDFAFDFIKLVESKSVGIDKCLLRNIIREMLLEYDVVRKIEPEGFETNNTNLMEIFFSNMKLNGFSEKTIKNYNYHIQRFLKFTNKSVLKMTTEDIRLFLTHIMNTYQIKNSTLETEKSILKSLFSWLELEEYILKSPAKKIRPTKVERRVRKAMSLEDIELLRCSCKTDRERCILELLFGTGIRLNELRQINVEDLNWQEKSITVVGKGNKERVVYFSPKTKVHIKKYLKVRPASNSNALIITSRNPRNRLGNRAIQMEIKRIAKRAGIEYSVFPHLFRHSFATIGLNSGVSINVLHDLLGHEGMDTTMNYAKTDLETIKHECRKYLNQ